MKQRPGSGPSALPRHHDSCGGLRPSWPIPTAKSSAQTQMNFKAEEDEALDAPVPTQPSLPAQDYRLVGDRRLAESWKGRAEDNLAAIQLMADIEAEGRHARPDEQELLAKFTAFGAVDLADKLFRRAGEGFAPAWEDLGLELERLVSREDLASLSRATQYAHFTPEFIVRAIWRTLRRMGFDGGRVLELRLRDGHVLLLFAPEALFGKPGRVDRHRNGPNALPGSPNSSTRTPSSGTRISRRRDCRNCSTFAIGNPPFSDRTVRADDPAGELRLSLHDYLHRPLGRAAAARRPCRFRVTSRWTMQDKLSTARRASTSPPWPIWIGARCACRRRNARPRWNRSRGRHPVPAKSGVREPRLAGASRGTFLPRPCRPWMARRRFRSTATSSSIPNMALGTHARTSSAYGPGLYVEAGPSRRLARSQTFWPRRSTASATQRPSRRAAISSMRARSSRSSGASRIGGRRARRQGDGGDPREARPHHPAA